MKVFGAPDIGDALLLSPRFAMDAAFRVRIAWGTIEVESSAFFTNPRRVVRLFLIGPTNIVRSDFSIALLLSVYREMNSTLGKKFRAKGEYRKAKRKLEASEFAAVIFSFFANSALSVKCPKPQ
jgi:hypothetical protein